MSQLPKAYDLEERTVKCAETIVTICQTIKQDAVTRPIINQLIRSATSIGANYAEANGASSKQDFRNKIFLCKKETQETRYWLRILTHALPSLKEGLFTITAECQELTLIFQKITSTLDSKTSKLKID